MAKQSAAYWLIDVGDHTQLWEEFQSKNIGAIGWDHLLQDLSTYEKSDEVQDALNQMKSKISEKNLKNVARAMFDFARTMKLHDVVFAMRGKTILGFGAVSSEYRFEGSRPTYRHVRNIEWLKTGEWEVPGESRVSGKALVDLSDDTAFVQKIINLCTRHEEGNAVAPLSQSALRMTPPPKNNEPYTREDALEDLFISSDEFDNISDALKFKKNIILQGPPGVGKTFVAERLAFYLMGETDQDRVEIVQFHPSYSYEDFIQGFRPHAGGFSLKNGVFYRFCQRTQQEPSKNYVFIIDEINRGNLAKIFGELLMLVEADKRDKKMTLTYSQNGEHFSIPGNVHIIGTMNTADRSLSLVDYALRRRFSFFALKPEFDSPGFTNHLVKLGVPELKIKFLQKQMKVLNQKISDDRKYLGPGFEIGHSYFCRKPKDLEFSSWYQSVLKNEVAHLLREYWFDDTERAEKEIRDLLAS